MNDARLSARPGRVDARASSGLQRLRLADTRDGLLHVPAGYDPTVPAPFVLTLHGAGGNASHALVPLMPLADDNNIILLAPDSRGQTWDMLYGPYGPDVLFIDKALQSVFSSYSIDASRLAVEGFSDGASYALSLGLSNGDLFTHIIAFSPGFMGPAGPEGEPRLFISHGIADSVLPMTRCSRVLVPALRKADYDVDYREFEGGHTVPGNIARAAVRWFLGDAGHSTPDGPRYGS